MQSGMSMHGTGICEYAHSQYFFISISWLCQDSQSAMSSCSVGVCGILMLYWWMLSDIFEASLTSLLHFLWILSPAVCALLSCWLHKWNSSGGIFLGHTVCLGLLFQYCYPELQHWLGFACRCYWPKCCSVGCFVFWGITFHTSLEEDLFWDPHPMHLFLGTTGFFCYRMPWLHPCDDCFCCVIQVLVCAFPHPLNLWWYEFSKRLTYLYSHQW